MDKHFADISRGAFLLILFLLTGLSVAILLSYVLLPQYKSYISSKDSLRTLKSITKDDRNYHLETEQIQATISTLEQQLDSEDIRLPFPQFEPYVISELQKLAWKNDIELGGVRPRQGQMVDHYREVLFDVDLSGEYFNLYRFLVELKQASASVVINEFSITPTTSTDLDPALAVKMTIASYRQEHP